MEFEKSKENCFVKSVLIDNFDLIFSVYCLKYSILIVVSVYWFNEKYYYV